VRQFAHAQIVDDEQRDGREVGEDRLARAVQRGVRQFFEPVGLVYLWPVTG
jgi:hypothetical protein